MSAIIKALRETFANSIYVLLAGTIGFTAFAFAVWLPNLHLIWQTFANTGASLSEKIKLLINLLGGIGTNFSLFSASYTVAIAILLGIDIAMVVYYARKRNTLERKSITTSIGAIASGAFGIGCAACGSVILSMFLGAASFLAYLPLRGGEFGILSVILLTASLFLISRKIAEPLTCNTKPL